GVELVATDAPPASAAAVRLHQPRVALYRSWDASMDEGWTRWVLERYGFAYERLTNEGVRTDDLSRFDAILLASQDADDILHGYSTGRMPPEYVGGIGLEGALALQEFVEGGGTLVAFDEATAVPIEAFGVPVRDATSDVDRDRLFIPGSLIRLRVDEEDPIAWGMRPEAAAFFSFSRAFAVSGDDEDSGRVDVVARYADEDLLMSGWEIGADRFLAGRPAVVNVRLGEGNVVLIGFRPQFRAQSRATLKLIFNALFQAATE
ncbi:MAG: M14 family metallopeptidase, partial [Gemmatimonadota bacterium]